MKKLTSWGLFIAVVLAVAVLAGPTSLGGPASYVIVDGKSMEPTYFDGDLVVAYQQETYEIGDVIVYDAPVDTQFNVIHRITEATEGGYITQGDNRDEVDGWIAPDGEIFGAALFHIPRGGAIVAFLRQPAAILAFLAGWLTLAIFDRRRSSDEEEADQEDRTDRADAEAVPDNPYMFISTQLAPVASLDTKPRQADKKPASNKTVAIFAIAALLGGSAGILVAHAASLRVDAGVLQAFAQTVDIDFSEPEPSIIIVEARFFDSGDGKEIGRSPVTFEPVEIPEGQPYNIFWNGPGQSTVVDCASEGIEFPGEPPSTESSGEGTFTPSADATHVLCIVTAPGNVPDNIDFAVLDDENVTEIHLTEVTDEGAHEAQGCDESDEAAECDQSLGNPEGSTQRTPDEGKEPDSGHRFMDDGGSQQDEGLKDSKTGDADGSDKNESVDTDSAEEPQDGSEKPAGKQEDDSKDGDQSGDNDQDLGSGDDQALPEDA